MNGAIKSRRQYDESAAVGRDRVVAVEQGSSSTAANHCVGRSEEKTEHAADQKRRGLFCCSVGEQQTVPPPSPPHYHPHNFSSIPSPHPCVLNKNQLHALVHAGALSHANCAIRYRTAPRLETLTDYGLRCDVLLNMTFSLIASPPNSLNR
jgi:hypothetical protein